MKKNYLKILRMGLGFVVLSQTLSAQTVVTIDKRQTYQTIDGFGGFAEMTSEFINDPNYVKLIINDLGATIIRDLLSQDYERTNENSDPFNLEMNKMTFSGSDVARRMSALKALKAEADAKGEPIKFLTTIWSPPGWMKYTKTVSSPDPIWNRLITSEEEILKGGTAETIKDMKDELAEYILAYLTYAKQQGVPMYAFSIQNELAFAQPYPSCVYTPQSYASTLGVVGKRLKDNNINTLLLGPEDIGDPSRYGSYIRAITSNPKAAPYLGISAVHAYDTDAVTAGSQSASTWTSMYIYSTRSKLIPFWQTETSGYGTDYEAAMKLSRAMYVALKFGKVSAWLFWGLSHPNATEGLTGSDKRPTSRYYVSKNLYRYVRPGAISVDATTADTSVLALAFQHNEKNTLSVVLINNSKDSDKTVNLKFAANTSTPTEFTRYLTSINENCASKGIVAANGNITLPRYSVTTLVGNNSFPVVTSIADNEAMEAVSIFPNPSKDVFNVKFPEGIYSEYSIMNSTGTVIIKKEVKNLTESIDMSGFGKGMYYFLANGNRKFLQKMIVE